MSGSGDEGEQQSSNATASASASAGRGANRRGFSYDSTLARSFAEQLDGAFTLDENLSSLSDTIANKHLTLQSQSRELEELQARIRAAEEALERAGTTVSPKSNGARDVRDLWASQSTTDQEDEAAYAEARGVGSEHAEATPNSSKVDGPPSRAAPPPPAPPVSSRPTTATRGTDVKAAVPTRAAPPPPPPGRPAPVPGGRPIPRKMNYESEEDDEDEDDEDEEDEDEDDEDEEEDEVPPRRRK